MGNDTVGARLKGLREAAGLTLEQAGEIAGTSKQSASQIEKGVTKVPGGLFLYRWAKRYNVNLEWLITGKGDPGASSSHSLQLDPAMLALAHQVLREAYADAGREPYSVETEPDALIEAYGKLVEAVNTTTAVVAIGRSIGPSEVRNEQTTGRTGGTDSEAGGKRAAGKAKTAAGRAR